MSSLLVKRADAVVTMGSMGVVKEADLLAEDGVIVEVGRAGTEADTVIDGRGMVLFPGMVNTHHHLYQTLTRALPGVHNAPLFPWLTALYSVWRHLTPEAIEVSTKVAIAELLLTGCTLTTDHLYIHPKGSFLDAEIGAAREMGIRFHPTRGSMSLGASRGGLPPDDVVATPKENLREMERTVRAYHDAGKGSMCRVALAPCSPFSVEAEEMEATRDLARRLGVRMHTHLAETLDEERFCLERFGKRPVALMEDLGWIGKDVWFAHCVHLSSKEVALFAATGTGVAHCPSSNLRLGSGIAPVREMLDKGVPVGLGVDGAASNDSSNMWAEARMALMAQRARLGVKGLSVAEAMAMATVGGARVLGWDDLGRLEPGFLADLFGVRWSPFTSGVHDEAAIPVLVTPPMADLTVVGGRVVQEGGRFPGLNMDDLVARHRRIAREMVEGACGSKR